jgi:hypothetical protein
VPPEIVAKLEQMAQDDPDEDVRQMVRKFLREP